MLDGGITKVGQTLIVVICGVVVLTTIFTLIVPRENEETKINQNELISTDKNVTGLIPIESDADEANSSAPYFDVRGAILDIHDSFDYRNYIVKCQSRDGVDLRPYVSVKNPVRTGVIGTYEVAFLLHWNGQEIIKTTSFRITNKAGYQ